MFWKFSKAPDSAEEGGMEEGLVVREADNAISSSSKRARVGRWKERASTSFFALK
jgi:hypothetical protein